MYVVDERGSLSHAFDRLHGQGHPAVRRSREPRLRGRNERVVERGSRFSRRSVREVDKEHDRPQGPERPDARVRDVVDRPRVLVRPRRHLRRRTGSSGLRRSGARLPGGSRRRRHRPPGSRDYATENGGCERYVTTAQLDPTPSIVYRSRPSGNPVSDWRASCGPRLAAPRRTPRRSRARPTWPGLPSSSTSSIGLVRDQRRI